MKISSDCKTQILDRLNILIKNYKKYLKKKASGDESSESSDLHQFISGKLDAYEECRDMVLKVKS
jgi:deoxyribodipyrimidine photolyase